MVSDQLLLDLGRFWLIVGGSSGDGWFKMIADVFGCMIWAGSGWFWMLAKGFL